LSGTARRATLTGTVTHLTTAEIESGLDDIRRSPADGGILRMIVRRPKIGERELLPEAELDLHVGLVGDTWKDRKSRRTPDGSPHPDMQLNIMNARTIDLLARDTARWPLAGDQLFVDLDLSGANLPPGTRLSLGTAVIEVTSQPHTGCEKFVERFGADAMKFVNSPEGRSLNMRGINAKVVQAGTIRVGDRISKQPAWS
jgi:MOSC domain-containing protein YiiM